MTRAPLSLFVSTPLQVIVDTDDVVSFRGEDASGGFGVLPGHVDLLTVLTPSVIRWKDSAGAWKFCALRGAVLTVSDGHDIRVACRKGVIGTDIALLQQQVVAEQSAESEAARRLALQQAMLHTRAIRQIMRHLSDHGGDSDLGGSPEGLFR